jgi:hypothetical protein
MLTVLLASGCGAHHSSTPPPQRRQAALWTSSAEPSPPGSAGRWSPVDEEQLRDSGR